jgi:hypothetical protein
MLILIYLCQKTHYTCSFHKINQQYHSPSHPQLNDFIVFICLKNITFNNLDYGVRRGHGHSWYADGAPMPDSKRRDVTPTYRQSVASISRSVGMVRDLFSTEMVHDLKRGRFNFQTLNRICCRTQHIRITRII